jgi:hypothetical protein
MESFRAYLPINKGIAPSSQSKITETGPDGIAKTRYRLTGTVSTTSLDRDEERVTRACMQDMATRIKAKPMPIFGNHEHSWENMLGFADNAEVLDNELQVSIVTDYAETNPKIPHLMGKMDGQMPLGLSIGGEVKEWHEAWEPSLKKKIKLIDKVDLWETSIVGIPANPDASLSLPSQIAKSLKNQGELSWRKEEIDLFNDSNLEKSSGQSGISSYGKLGETTPESRCPKCGKPSELHKFENGTASYLCRYDGTMFNVDSQGVTVSTEPVNQPAKQPVQTIDRQVQEPLGKKEAKTTKGDVMKGVSKEAEAEAEAKVKRKEAEAPAEGEAPAREESDEDDETGYVKFCGHMERYRKEFAAKSEGTTTVPGGENAKPSNTLGGSGGAASPVHAKSAQTFESLKKALKENVPVEGLVAESSAPEKADLSFKSIRESQLKRK